MIERRWAKIFMIAFTFLFFLCYALEVESFARAGGGMSSGSRGSRSYSAPSQPSGPGPSQSYSSPTRPAPTPSPVQPQPQSGGFMRSLAGGIAGGFLGSMLFRGLGFGGNGGWGGGGGIGIFEILLLLFILFMVYRFLKKRREQAAETGGAYYQASPDMQQTSYGPSYNAGNAPEPAGGADLETGLRYIRQMDPSFDENRFQDACMDIFFKIQGAWTNRDLSSIRNLFTAEMYGIMQSDVERMKQERKVNKLDNIAVRSVDITEAWQETGKDFITVRFYANLLDYTTDEAGQVLSGSRTDPVKFEEYWTFTRPVGNNVWQLSAINQAQ
jgi:predicted lipid-binding transport protein (Tim44 family)